MFTRFPNSRAVALPLALIFLLNGAYISAGDVSADDVSVDDVSANESSPDDKLTSDNVVLSVSSMPLRLFAAAVEESLSISIEVDESIADFTIDGQFDGSIDYLLGDLYNRYGIDHSVLDDVYKLWRDSDFSSPVDYQFQLSDMDLLAFLSYLSDAAGYQLVADTSIKISVDGTFSGTLRDTINALSHQYPVLFYISEDTISVVPESSFVKGTVLLMDDNYSPEAFLTDLRTRIPPGNFVNREDNRLIVGGHPDFVRRTELELKVDMSNAASIIPELLTTRVPVISDTDSKIPVDQTSLELPENSAASAPSVLSNQPDVVIPERAAEVAATAGQDTESAVTPEPDAELEAVAEQVAKEKIALEQEADEAVTPEQDVEVAATPEQNTEEAVISEQDVEVAATPEQNTDEAVLPEQDVEAAATPEQNAEEAVMSEQDAEVPVPSEQNVEVAVTPPEQDAEVTVEPEQSTEEAVKPKQDADAAVTPEQDADVSAAPEKDAEAAVTPKDDVENAVTSEQNAEVVVAPLEPEGGDAAASETKANVDAVDEIPGFY